MELESVNNAVKRSESDMSYGFMGQLLRVDLTDQEITVEEINQTWAKQYLGGAGLATKYFYEEVPGGVDPLGPDTIRLTNRRGLLP